MSKARKPQHRRPGNNASSSQPNKTLLALESSGSTSPGDGEITIFLSYARADDAIYNMVHPFKELLSHFVYAKSGRRVRAFLDQDSIGWGEIWRERLESEILRASVFIPLLSASYLDSDNCRMEFNRFQANATALGVKELLLPVLVVNAPAIFHENSTDDIVREAAARQWEVIEDAVLADAGSSSWKTTMARVADRLVAAYEIAEASLADPDGPGSTSVLANAGELITGDEHASQVENDEEPGLAELLISINDELSDLTAASQEMSPAVTALGAAATSAGSLPTNPTPAQVQTWSQEAARSFSPPATVISDAGEKMFVVAKALDVDMQRLRRLAVELLPAMPEIAESYNKMVNQLNGVEAVGGQLEGLLAQMKPAESFSIPLRKALRPARQGLTRVRDSLRLINSWHTISVD